MLKIGQNIIFKGKKPLKLLNVLSIAHYFDY